MQAGDNTLNGTASRHTDIPVNSGEAGMPSVNTSRFFAENDAEFRKKYRQADNSLRTVPGVFPITDFRRQGLEKLRGLKEETLKKHSSPSASMLNNMDFALANLNKLNASLSSALEGRLGNSNPYADDLILTDYLSGKTLNDFRRKENYLNDLDKLGRKYLNNPSCTDEFRAHIAALTSSENSLNALRQQPEDTETYRIKSEDLSDLCLKEFNVADGIRKALISGIKTEIRRLELKNENSMREFLENALETQFKEMWDSIDFCTGQGIPYSVYSRSFGGSGDDEEIRDMTEHYVSAYLKNRGGREQALSAYSVVRPSASGSMFLKYLNVVKRNIPLMKMLESLGRTLGLDTRAGKKAEKLYSERMAAHGGRAQGEHITGITLGNTLNYALPEELARLADPDLEYLFDIKLLNHELLTFDFLKMAKVFAGGKGKTEESTEERGPVIVCVDTSGSMKGEAEDYAKAVTTVLALKCIEASRPCHIINFAIETETLTINDADGDEALEALNTFLKRSFRGGTSIDNALQQVSKMIEREPDFAMADLLCITDGKYMFSQETVTEAARIKRKFGTRYLEFIKGFSDFNKNGIFDKIFVICNNNFTEK